MILPNKYEDPHTTPFVIGAEIIKLLSKKDYSIKDLYSPFSSKLSIDRFYDVLTFLYISRIINYSANNIYLLNDTD